LYGAKGIEKQEIECKLEKINSELNSFKRKISSLEKQKIVLTEALKTIKS